MRLAAAGDAGAYRALLNDLARAVRANARATLARSGQGNAEVEDIVQETLLAVHLKRDTWNPELPFAPWVNAIARYKITDSLRRRGRRVIVPIEDVADTVAAPAERDSDSADIERMVKRLGERAQKIVRAISLEGRSAASVAGELGMSEGAVRVALHRALAELARLYRSESA